MILRLDGRIHAAKVCALGLLLWFSSFMQTVDMTEGGGEHWNFYCDWKT